MLGANAYTFKARRRTRVARLARAHDDDGESRSKRRAWRSIRGTTRRRGTPSRSSRTRTGGKAIARPCAVNVLQQSVDVRVSARTPRHGQDSPATVLPRELTIGMDEKRAPRGSIRCHAVCHSCANLRATVHVESVAPIRRVENILQKDGNPRQPGGRARREPDTPSFAVMRCRLKRKFGICLFAGTSQPAKPTRGLEPRTPSLRVIARVPAERMVEPNRSPKSAPCATCVPFCIVAPADLGNASVGRCGRPNRRSQWRCGENRHD
jgi:hypothetical protein